eukprot:480414-Rhodomonas_salina.2
MLAEILMSAAACDCNPFPGSVVLDISICTLADMQCALDALDAAVAPLRKDISLLRAGCPVQDATEDSIAHLEVSNQHPRPPSTRSSAPGPGTITLYFSTEHATAETKADRGADEVLDDVKRGVALARELRAAAERRRKPKPRTAVVGAHPSRTRPGPTPLA